MKVFQHEKQLRTAGGLTVTDITEEVVDAVRASGVVDGIPEPERAAFAPDVPALVEDCL